MFIGHFGVGFAAKKAAPRVSLGTLFLSVQFVDLLWPTLLLLGVEHVEISPGITKSVPLDFTDYPISHSLVMACAWGVLVGGIYWLFRREVRSAVVVGACVVSHWVLDLLVHRPDLPLWPGASPKLGLGLWEYPLLTAIVESLIFLGGAFLYARSTRPLNAAGKYALMGLIAFLIVSHAANILGPPPPSVAAIAWAGQLQWLFVVLAWWVDRNRTSRE